MKTRLSIKKTIDDSFKGIKKAFRTYEEWSDGEWLGMAPEGFIVSQIARELAKNGSIVTLEDTVDRILKWSGAERRGKPPRGSKTGRFDIIVWSKSSKPKILIEVKKAWEIPPIVKDVQRLKQMMNKKDSSVSTGLIAVYSARKTKKGICQLLNGIKEKCGLEIVRKEVVKPKDGEGWMWCAAVFRLYKEQ